MYCTNCGKEIDGKVKFCTNCGSPIFIDRNRRKKQIIVVVLLCVLLLVGLVILGISFRSQSSQNEKSPIEKELNEIVEEDSETSEIVEAHTPESYMSRAKEYVEMGDLYKAREILKEGYERTQLEEFKQVTIWGPLSEVDMVLSTSYGSTAIRQEYHFDGDRVTGYQYSRGLIKLEKGYYFNEEGFLVGMDITNCNTYKFGGGEYSILCPYDMTNITDDKEIINFDYSNYSENNGDIKVTSNRSSNYIFHVQEGICYTADIDNMGENIIFTYDDRGRITSFSYYVAENNNFMETFTYGEDGSYTMHSSDAGGRVDTIQYDSNGKEINGYVDFHSDLSWAVVWENEKVKEIYVDDQLIYEFVYEENGHICEAKNFEEGIETLGITYGDDGNIGYVYLKMASGEEIKKCYDYDVENRMIGGYVEYVSAGDVKFFECEYTDKDDLLKIKFQDSMSTYAYTFEYDEMGRNIQNEYAIYQYVPGTYTGVAEGWAGDFVVEVTVDESRILEVEVIQHCETAGVGTKVIDPMIEKVMNANSTQVDTISGSTITSQSVLNAINNALEQAKIQ